MKEVHRCYVKTHYTHLEGIVDDSVADKAARDLNAMALVMKYPDFWWVVPIFEHVSSKTCAGCPNNVPWKKSIRNSVPVCKAHHFSLIIGNVRPEWCPIELGEVQP